MDGNAVHCDDQDLEPKGTFSPGRDAFLDTNGAQIGEQFAILISMRIDPRSPVAKRFNRHIYEVDRHEMIPAGETLVHCKHIGPATSRSAAPDGL
jgi:hypothetical protein